MEAVGLALARGGAFVQAGEVGFQRVEAVLEGGALAHWIFDF